MSGKFIAMAVFALLILPLAYSEDAADLDKYLDHLNDKKVDIVFVFDTTNSMGGEINELRSFAHKFAKDLEAYHIDYRLGLVEFRDFPLTCGEGKKVQCGSSGDFAYRVKSNGTLTAEISTFNSWLDELKAGGGGSEGPEAVLAALRQAGSVIFWRDEAEKRIIVLTDAGVHPDGSCCNAERDTLEGTILGLTHRGARVDVIGPDDSSLKKIAKDTGGQFFKIRSELSLKPLLEEITEAISYIFNATAEATCENNTLEAKVRLVGKEAIPNLAGQTEVWMYIDNSGSRKRYDLIYNQVAGVYQVKVPNICGSVDLDVYGLVGERSTVQTLQVDCNSCRAKDDARESFNQPPEITILMAEPGSPQDAGINVTWTANASDLDGDPVFYRFFLNYVPMTDWTNEKTWTWAANEAGSYRIEVRVRDANHNGPSGLDDRRVESFTINEPKSEVEEYHLWDAQAMDWWLKGYNLSDHGKYDEAIEAYDESIKLDPIGPFAWEDKGYALNELGKYSEAIEAYDEAIRLYIGLKLSELPGFHNLWAGKGTSLYHLGKYDEAVEAYDEAIKLYPNSIYWLNKGFILQGMNKYEEAIDSYDKAIELDPNYAEPWNRKGMILHDLGKYDKAIKAFDEAIKLDSTIDRYWNYKGLTLADQGKYDEAIEAFEKAIKLNSTNASIWSNKGSVLDDQGKYVEAIEAYNEAIKLDPSHTMAWLNKGNALYDQGKYAEAINFYDEAIRLDPNFALAWNNKGYALVALGRTTEANAAFAKAEELGESIAAQNETISQNSGVNSFMAWYNKGVALQNLGKYAEAVEAYNEAIRLDPTIAEAWNNKGNALDELAKYSEAIRAYDEAIRLDPDYAMAWYNKGIALGEHGSYDEAIKCFAEAIKIDPNFAQAWKDKGYALKLLGNTSESDAAYARAEELDA